jgi:hypothetical protein
MLGIQLTALSAPEVKRLLELARARGQEGLARQLEAELASRPGRTAGPPLPMSAVPRSAPRRSAPPPIRRRGPALLVAGLAAFIGGAVAWGLSLNPPQTPRPQAVTLAAAETPPRIAVALTTTALPEESPDQPFREPSAPGLVAELPREPVRAGGHNPCLDLPTAHERLVCGYPSLAIQDRRMRAALDQARADGADPRALEDAQAAWQAGSSNVQDRLVLAERYARRIAEIESQ